MIGWAVGAIAGGIGYALDSKEKAERADEIREAEMLAATYQYKAQEYQANFTKQLALEDAINNVAEIERAGAEQGRQTALAVDTAASKKSASNEGLASGNTRGRDLATMYVKGSKAVNKASDQVKSMVGQVSDNLDKVSNQTNMELFNAYNQYVAVLTQPGPGYSPTIGGLFSAMGQGASGGANLQSNLREYNYYKDKNKRQGEL